jgi:hypothetical protein
MRILVSTRDVVRSVASWDGQLIDGPACDPSRS